MRVDARDTINLAIDLGRADADPPPGFNTALERPLANGIAFGGATTHRAIDQLACNFERGRQIWLRFALRPLAFGK